LEKAAASRVDFQKSHCVPLKTRNVLSSLMKLGEDKYGPALWPGARGQRLVAAMPHGHWMTTTFVAGLRHDEITAPCVFEGDEQRGFLDLCRTISRPNFGQWRHRDHGQSRQSQSR
jgi:hypothetical protein